MSIKDMIFSAKTTTEIDELYETYGNDMPHWEWLDKFGAYKFYTKLYNEENPICEDPREFLQ